jgi:hypothetical protein
MYINQKLSKAFSIFTTLGISLCLASQIANAATDDFSTQLGTSIIKTDLVIAGKNDQHGSDSRSAALQAEIDRCKEELAELKRTQGPKKEKDTLERKITNLKQEMDKAKKGENHSQKAKGSNGQPKR